MNIGLWKPSISTTGFELRDPTDPVDSKHRLGHASTPGLAHRVAGIWGNSRASEAVLYFLALDPTRKPVLVELPEPTYERLINRWMPPKLNNASQR